MNDNYPDLVVEIHRYDNPNTYRFFSLESGPFMGGMMYRPFRKVDDPGPVYNESHREQIGSEEAQVRRKQLHKDEYKPVPFLSLPVDLAFWVTHHMAPIEFHQALDSRRDQKMANRITVWVRGELPA
jgi:hypothetical protein